MRRLFANLTDGLFGYRLRYKRWRRWPFWIMLALVWAPLLLWGGMMLLDPDGADIIARDHLEYKYHYAQEHCELGPSFWILSRIGAAGQILIAGVVLLVVPLLASRAFAREKAAGNMMDLVLLPVERRKLVLGRLGKVALPFLILVLWSLPTYTVMPLIPEELDMRWVWVLLALNAPGTIMTPAFHFFVGEVWLSFKDVTGYLATGIPFFTMLGEVILLSVVGLLYSLRSKTWFSAVFWSYVATIGVLLLELLPLAIIGMADEVLGWIRLDDETSGFLALGLAGAWGTLFVRGVLPLLLLRSAIKNFDRWAMGEKKK